MFCAALFRGLERQGLSYAEVNIWDNADAAAFVRSVAGGNETVPTVRVGDVALVNPTPRAVLRAVAEEVPEQLPDDVASDEFRPGPFARFVTRLLGG